MPTRFVASWQQQQQQQKLASGTFFVFILRFLAIHSFILGAFLFVLFCLLAIVCNCSYTVFIRLRSVVSILLLAIIIGVATALLASLAFQFLAPVDNSVLSPAEQNCQNIANRGYQIHQAYPGSSLDQLPNDVFEELSDLDELWITQCVSVLPADSLFSIINNVERGSSFGE